MGPRGDIPWLCAPVWHSPAVLSELVGGAGIYAVTPVDRYVWGGTGWNGKGWNKTGDPPRLAAIEDPANTVFMLDAPGWGADNFQLEWWGYLQGNFYVGNRRHQDGMNFSWIDGHARWAKLSTLRPGVLTIAGDD